ncbi:uncharacterized protein LOC127240043 [Andrographis paniculata]|uniref:uncharacterized protein LOC127240043 n=1 Tax=Andrographis paniculata TaxID=175694 RepID=UPI0021E96B45|nr:uncharacterized protein LOC127240043 [Andrographis paniculata]XP_051114421.1 uncharacterized protein LOC127240043 [Andrographis paniculata]
MDDRISPASSSSAAARGRRYCGRRRSPEEESGGDRVACTGKSCQSCTAGVIADCVAVCCCPCAVVNILALAFVKLPWAVARRCIGGRRRNNNGKRIMVEEEKGNRECHCRRRVDAAQEDSAVAGKGRELQVATAAESFFRCGGMVVAEEEELNDGFGAEDVWWELHEVGHLGFGRVSFTGISFQRKGN